MACLTPGRERGRPRGTSDPVDLEIRAAETLKRVVRPGAFSRSGSLGSLQQILAFMEIKTVWHPKGH
jgi:hypothetical protein